MDDDREVGRPAGRRVCRRVGGRGLRVPRVRSPARRGEQPGEAGASRRVRGAARGDDAALSTTVTVGPPVAAGEGAGAVVGAVVGSVSARWRPVPAAGAGSGVAAPGR